MGKFKKWEMFAALFLVCLTALTQIIFLHPPELSDQMQYYRAAVRFPRFAATPSHWSMRLGVIFPTAVMYRLFGHSEIAYYTLPFLSAVAFTLSTFFIGLLLFNRKVALIAASWLALLPGFLNEAGHLLPDITASACLNIGVILLLLCDGSNEKRDRWRLIVSGAFFGWAYLCKEYFAVFALLVPLALWLRGISFKKIFRFAIGVLLIAAIELTVNGLVYEDVFIRLRTTTPRETWGHIERNMRVILTHLFTNLRAYDGHITLTLVLAGLAGSFYFFVRRKKEFIFLFAWTALIYTFYTTLALLPVLLGWEDRVLLRPHIFRYWLPILPPLLISTIAALDRLLKKLAGTKYPQITSAVFLISLLVISTARGILVLKNDEELLISGGTHYHELRSFLREEGQSDRPIWIVRDLKVGYEYMLPMYANNFFGRAVWQGTYKYLNTGALFLKPEEITQGRVLIDRHWFNPNFVRIPDYLAEIPETWTLEFETSNGWLALYAVD